eukprot:3640552-Pleurochrysis_carterae.AAC.2
MRSSEPNMRLENAVGTARRVRSRNFNARERPCAKLGCCTPLRRTHIGHAAPKLAVGRAACTAKPQGVRRRSRPRASLVRQANLLWQRPPAALR